MGKPAKKSKWAVDKWFSVVKFEENGRKLFDCIPDKWFADEEKTSCFWPPKSGKSFKLRALNYETPDDLWEKVPCSLVSDGYSTYSSGFDKVREKCSQKFNTSSADEQMEALNFRRKHPALTLQANESFEHLFSKPTNLNIDEPKNTESNLSENHMEKEAATTNKVKKTKKTQIIGVRQDLSKENEERDTEVVKRISENRKSPSKSNHCNLSSSGSTLILPQFLPSSTFTRATPCVQLKSSDILPETRSNVHSASDRSRSNNSTNHSARRSISNAFASQSNSSSRSRSKSLLSRVRTSSKSSHSSKTSNIGSQRYRNSRIRSRSISTLRNEIRERCGRSTISHSPRPRHLTTSNGSASPYNTSLQRREQCGTSITSHSPRPRRLSRSNGSASPCNTGLKRHRNSLRRSRSRSTLRNRNREQCGTSITSHSPRPRRLSRSNGSASPSNTGLKRHRNSRRRSRSRSTLRNRIREQCGSSITSHSPCTRRLSGSNSSQNQMLPIQAKTSAELMTELLKIVKQNNADTDRRLTRMEVTINKVFVTVADMKRSNNLSSSSDRNRSRRSRSSHRSRSALSDVPRVPRGFKVPTLPIRDIRELSFYSQNLKKTEFRDFMLKHEKEFCVPANTSNNVVMIAYLKRFISLELRCLVTLIDKKGDSKYTLYGDFRRVYDFLIDVMKSGFRSYSKGIKTAEIHIVLRTIWGRTNQMLKEKQRKSKK